MTPSQTVKDFGRQLSDIRARRGLSLRELAALAKTSHQTVAAFEAGTGSNLQAMLRIASRLGMRVELVPDDQPTKSASVKSV